MFDGTVNFIEGFSIILIKVEEKIEVKGVKAREQYSKNIIVRFIGF